MKTEYSLQERRKIDNYILAHTNPDGDRRLLLLSPKMAPEVVDGFTKAEEMLKKQIDQIRDLLKIADEWRPELGWHSHCIEARCGDYTVWYDLVTKKVIVRTNHHGEDDFYGEGPEDLERALHDFWII